MTETQRDYTPAEIEQGIAAAVKARDFPAVVSLLKMLACRDPHRAQVVYDAMTMVLDMTKDGSNA